MSHRNSLLDSAGIAVCILQFAFAVHAAERPGSQKPLRLLPAGALEFNHDLYRRMAAKYQEMVERYDAIFKNGSTAELRKSKRFLLEIGNAHTSGVQAARMADELRLSHEPAGYDVLLRVKAMEARLYELRLELLKNPDIEAQLKSVYPNWLKKAEKLQQRALGAKRLADHGRLGEAFDLLCELLDELEPQGYWYEQTKKTPGIFPIAKELSEFNDRYRTALANERNAAIDQRRLSLLRALAAAADEMEAAVRSAATTGKGTLGGREAAGPDLLEAVFQRWREAHLQALRATAWGWCRHLEKTQGISEAPELGTVERQYERISAAASGLCARTIAVDADRASAGEAPLLHQRYLEALLPLARFGPGHSLIDETHDALDRLAGRSPEYAGELAAYRRATGEVLRWRERVAAASGRAKSLRVPTLDEALGRALVRKATGAEIARNEKPRPVWALVETVPDFISDVAPKVVGKTVIVGDILGAGFSSSAGFSSPTGTPCPAMGRYASHALARSAETAADWPGLADELRSCLWADDRSPPLTLEAHLAIESAQRGDCVMAQGTLDAFDLDALVTSFQNVDDSDVGALPLGILPTRDAQYDPHREIILAIEFKPVWFQHRYGIVEAAAK